MDDNKINNNEEFREGESIERENTNENINFELVQPEVGEEVKEEPPRYVPVSKPEPKKKKSFRGSFLSYVALALVTSLLGGLVATYIGPNIFGNAHQATGNQYTAEAINITPSDDISIVAAVAKKAKNSVVGIQTVETQRNFFFEPQDVTGVGSGVIVDSNGYILTNSHVIANGNAKDIKVNFENSDTVPGTLLWYDALLDLAIIKVDLTNLPAATLGDSDKLEVGEIAVAIGNPLGLEFQRTVTSGIISGLNRSVRVEQAVMQDLIQTDASINPGNSGGPLLNAKGEVIGINTAKVRSGEGLGFAIPINQAKAIVEQVVENGTFKTVFMGITGVSVEEYERALGVDLSVEKGVVLIKIEAGSAADKAGLMVGDVIVKIDDTDLENMGQLKKSLFKYKQGDKATLSVMRNGREQKIDIEFTEVR